MNRCQIESILPDTKPCATCRVPVFANANRLAAWRVITCSRRCRATAKANMDNTDVFCCECKEWIGPTEDMQSLFCCSISCMLSFHERKSGILKSFVKLARGCATCELARTTKDPSRPNGVGYVCSKELYLKCRPDGTPSGARYWRPGM